MRDLLSYCRSILSSLHAFGFPEALVVGGAIRDLDNGKAHLVKDIDIIVFDSPGYLDRLKRAMIGFHHRLAVPEFVTDYSAFENVVCVHEFTEVGAEGDTIPVQIILAREPREWHEILERHDFGLCQIGFDGNRIVMTDAYKWDKFHHEFTLVRCRDQKDYDRSSRRYLRLTAKYEGWPMKGTFTP